MELLQQMPDRGYPDEYLLSRIRGRKSRLITNWTPLIVDGSTRDYLAAGYQGFIRERTPGGMWINVEREYRWVYGQMNAGLREGFGPFFLYSELRTVFISLRHLWSNGSEKASSLLEVSLLCPGIKKLLADSADVPAALAGMEPLFAALSARFSGLAGVYESEGLRGFEQKLTNTYLTVMARTRLHPVIQTFFRLLIDARNIISRFKFLLFEHKTAPPFLEGGTIGAARFRKLTADVSGIYQFLREFSGVRTDRFDPSRVETALYRGITRTLRKNGRDPLGAGLILDYLWRCSLEATNAGILLGGRGLDHETLAAELVW